MNAAKVLEDRRYAATRANEDSITLNSSRSFGNSERMVADRILPPFIGGRPAAVVESFSKRGTSAPRNAQALPRSIDSLIVSPSPDSLPTARWNRSTRQKTRRGMMSKSTCLTTRCRRPISNRCAGESASSSTCKRPKSKAVPAIEPPVAEPTRRRFAVALLVSWGTKNNRRAGWNALGDALDKPRVFDDRFHEVESSQAEFGIGPSGFLSKGFRLNRGFCMRRVQREGLVRH